METRSDFLFAKPSFWEGWARLFDFGNTIDNYNASTTEQTADEIAIGMDWRVVGNDLRKAFRVADESIDHSTLSANGKK